MLLHSEPLLAAVRRARDILLRPPPDNQSEGEIALRMELSVLLCTHLIDEIERTYFPGATTDRLKKCSLQLQAEAKTFNQP